MLSAAFNLGTEWPILCWGAVKKLLTHSLIDLILIVQHAERATPVLQQQSQQMQSMSSDKNNAGLASFQWMSAPGGTTNNMMTQQQLPAPELQGACNCLEVE